MYERRKTGIIGEKVACDYLKNKGYTIIERNFRCKMGEIDIIAWKNDEIIFIEVKTRSSNYFGKPAESVTERKRKHIYKAAKYYMMVKDILEQNARIDVIEVYIKKNKYIIHHIKQVY